MTENDQKMTKKTETKRPKWADHQKNSKRNDRTTRSPKPNRFQKDLIQTVILSLHGLKTKPYNTLMQCAYIFFC